MGGSSSSFPSVSGMQGGTGRRPSPATGSQRPRGSSWSPRLRPRPRPSSTGSPRCRQEAASPRQQPSPPPTSATSDPGSYGKSCGRRPDDWQRRRPFPGGCHAGQPRGLASPTTGSPAARELLLRGRFDLTPSLLRYPDPGSEPEMASRRPPHVWLQAGVPDQAPMAPSGVRDTEDGSRDNRNVLERRPYPLRRELPSPVQRASGTQVRRRRSSRHRRRRRR